MKQGREASSTSEVPSLFPRSSPVSTAERRWLLQHSSTAHTHRAASSMTVQENEQDNSPPHRLQPGLCCSSSPNHTTRSGAFLAAECDCPELPNPPLKHPGYCSHSFLSPACFRVTRALLRLQVEILKKRQRRREKEMHETEDTWER